MTGGVIAATDHCFKKYFFALMTGMNSVTENASTSQTITKTTVLQVGSVNNMEVVIIKKCVF